MKRNGTTLLLGCLVALPALGADRGEYNANVGNDGRVRQASTAAANEGARSGAKSAEERMKADRDRVAEKTQKRIDGYDERLSQLRDRRDKIDKNSPEYGRLDMRANALEARIAEAKANLKSMKDSHRFAAYEKRIEQTFHDLDRMFDRGVAE